jgi:hypothetical protein
MIPQKIDKRYIQLEKHPARSCKISCGLLYLAFFKKKFIQRVKVLPNEELN